MRDLSRQNEYKDKTVSVLAANSVFLIGVVMLFILNFLAYRLNIEWEILGVHTFIMQITFFLIPALLYIVIKRKDLRHVLRLNKLSIGNSVLIVVITIFLIPTIGCINYMIQVSINVFGRPLPNPMPAIDSMYHLMIGIIIIAIAPAICEEVLARGVIMRGYERFGNKTAWVVSATLFSIMHRNIQSVIPIFLIGIFLAYIVYRTNSIWAGVIAHFINNAVAVGLLYLAGKIQHIMGIADEQVEHAAILQADAITIMIVIGVFIFCAAAFAGFMTLFIENTRKIKTDSKQSLISKQKVPFAHYVPMMIGVILIILDFIGQVQYIIE